MKDLDKINKLIDFYSNIQNVLRNEKYDLEKLDVIITISGIYESIIENFDYDFNRLYNSITKLDESISTGNVYKILEEGTLLKDRFEKGYIFLEEGASILLHSHYKEKEHYKCISGNKDAISSNFCNIGSSHEITGVNTDTLVRTYEYVPGSMIK